MKRRFTSIVLVVLVALFRLFHGRAFRCRRHPRRVGIIQWTGNVGDAVCITPLFRALKKELGANVIVFGREKVGEVFRDNLDVDVFHPIIEHALSFARFLRTLNLDSVLVTNPGASGVTAPFLAGVSCIISMAPVNTSDEPMLFRFLKSSISTVQLRVRSYIPGQYLHLLGSLGVQTDDHQFHLGFSRDASLVVDELFQKEKIDKDNDMIVAIAPGGGEQERWWPAKRYANIANELHRRYGAVTLLVGAGGDKDAIDAIEQELEENVHSVNLLNQPIDEFKATMQRVHLAVRNDSAPMVFADAFGVPNVTIVGPTDEQAYHLAAPTSFVALSKERGEPLEDARGWSTDNIAEARRQIEAVGVSDVLQEIESAMIAAGRIQARD